MWQTSSYTYGPPDDKRLPMHACNTRSTTRVADSIKIILFRFLKNLILSLLEKPQWGADYTT